MKYLFILTLSFTLFSCSHHHHSPHSVPAQQVSTGTLGDLSYSARSNTYFMGQPTPQTLDAAKVEGITTVINLRTPEEIKALKFSPSDEAHKRGMSYYNYPIDAKKPLDPAALKEIETTFMLHHKKGEKVIVHCASGQRAATWFAYHVKTNHKMDNETALKEAGEVGLKNEKLIESFKNLKF